MKIIIGLLIALSVSASFAYDEIETIRDLVELYEPQAKEKFGYPIQLRVLSSSEMNAFAGVDDYLGRPILGVTRGALRELKDDEVLATMCHEMGHLFGEILVKEFAPLAVEGEADYFEGSCVLRFLKEVRGMSKKDALEQALDIVKNEAVAFNRGRLIWEKAYQKFYKGINPTYAQTDCRLLTAIHGVYGYKRPKCWYNPANLNY